MLKGFDELYMFLNGRTQGQHRADTRSAPTNKINSLYALNKYDEL